MRETRFVMTVSLAGVLAGAGCAGAAAGGAGAPAPASRPASDTTGLIPAGLGSLRQDDIAIHMNVEGVNVRALPLGDDFIRTLAPDSHRALLAIRDSRRAAIDSIRMRTGRQSVDVWYVSFIAVQQGESRYNPHDLFITNQARDFRPIDIIPITSGFTSQRLRQREQAHALYVFDAALDPNQPLTMTIGLQTGGDWRSVLQRVEAERARIRARGGELQGGIQSW